MKRLDPTWTVILAAIAFVSFASYLVEQSQSLKESCSDYKIKLQDHKNASRHLAVLLEVMRSRTDKLPAEKSKEINAKISSLSRTVTDTESEMSDVELKMQSFCSRADLNALQSKYLLIFYSAFASIISYWAGTRKQQHG